VNFTHANTNFLPNFPVLQEIRQIPQRIIQKENDMGQINSIKEENHLNPTQKKDYGLWKKIDWFLEKYRKNYEERLKKIIFEMWKFKAFLKLFNKKKINKNNEIYDEKSGKREGNYEEKTSEIQEFKGNIDVFQLFSSIFH